jgi:MscS family membrane protein
MEFLNNIYFNNTLKSYLIVVGTILLAVLLKRFLSRYIASVLFKLLHKFWPNVAKNNFVDLLLQPLELFLLICVTVFAIDKLNFPEELHITLYGHSSEDILSRVGIAIIIISFTFLLLRIIDFVAYVLEQKAEQTANKEDDQLIIFLRDFLKVVMVIICFLMLLKACFNQPIGTLLTSLSIVGAAIALAAKESLENLIASFIIFFDKPFTAGDTLKVNAVFGKVEKIGLRSTRIRTADKTLVTVPNKQMVDSVVDNWSMRTHRRAEIKLELQPQTSATQIQNCIALIKNLLATKQDEFTSNSVHITELTNKGISVSIEYFTNPINMDAFSTLKEQIIMEVKKLLEENDMVLSNNNTITILNDVRKEE